MGTEKKTFLQQFWVRQFEKPMQQRLLVQEVVTQIQMFKGFEMFALQAAPAMLIIS